MFVDLLILSIIGAASYGVYHKIKSQSQKIYRVEKLCLGFADRYDEIKTEIKDLQGCTNTLTKIVINKRGPGRPKKLVTEDKK